MAKKEFSSPAGLFIEERLADKETAQEAAPEIAAPAQEVNIPVAPQVVPKGYYMQVVESRSKRVQVVFTPSLYKAAASKAKKLKISFNEYVNRLVTQDLNPEIV